MKQLLGSEWNVRPAGGSTGDAFFAENNGTQLFLKRNTSPFLAVLSAEGIVPKLVWTKRMENGDVISAQHWKVGRHLTHAEMSETRVAKLLKKIHQSDALLQMLIRMKGEPLLPFDIYTKVRRSVTDELLQHSAVREAIAFLEKMVPSIPLDYLTVCHGDVIHNNWLFSNDGELYLVDWDDAVIADPTMDIGLILMCYVPTEDWQDWLVSYGAVVTESFEMRIKWYTLVLVLSYIERCSKTGKQKEMNYWFSILDRCLQMSKLFPKK